MAPFVKGDKVQHIATAERYVVLKIVTHVQPTVVCVDQDGREVKFSPNELVSTAG